MDWSLATIAGINQNDKIENMRVMPRHVKENGVYA
jgi:hypothetical protein